LSSSEIGGQVKQGDRPLPILVANHEVLSKNVLASTLANLELICHPQF
jgi:hypothetical protein